MRPDRSDRRQSGFMLIEVVAAGAVAVIMLVALLRVFGSVWDLNGRVREEANAIVVAQAVLEQTAQRRTLAAGAQAGRSGDYGWSVQVTAIDVPRPEDIPESDPRRRLQAQRHGKSQTSLLSQTSEGTGSAGGNDGAVDDDDDGGSGGGKDAAKPFDWQLFRIQVAVLSPTGRQTNLETLRLAPLAQQR